ncbi:MAG TPA: aminotransferase class V-fold PLP-dependent enzyme [Thermomicrobiales bacterium]|nr:aminotransferase class V-fold PLP-dependent enzyme [Thermomicrobiales bacterium]
MVDTDARREPRGTGIYDRLGVRTIVNARGATTAVGGTLMPPEVLAAMAEAARAFVVLDELNAAVGRRIAAATGAEAGYVTAGSAAGMALAVAACIAGSDPARIRRLPHSEGLANEVVIHRAHRIAYDQMFRVGGGRLVEIGLAGATEPWELEAAIGARTAAVAYVDSPSAGRGALPFPVVVETAHRRGVPVLVDAASTLPPVAHLRRWVAQGADLVIYSGGKGIRGPQDSGFLAGRADLIAAAAANGNPRSGVGRGMKVSKEAMVGLAVALDRFLAHDHDADFAAHRAQAEALVEGLAGRDDLRCELVADEEAYPAPVVVVAPRGAGWAPGAVRDALAAGTPSIHCNAAHGRLEFHTHCLVPGDEETIVARLREVLDAPAAR